MVYRLFLLIIGVSVVFTGLNVFKKSTFSFHGIDIYIGKNNYIITLLIIFFGLVFIISAFRKKEDLEGEFTYLKCPKCGEVFSKKKSKNKTCKRCGTALEDLDGFFDRHPEK